MKTEKEIRERIKRIEKIMKDKNTTEMGKEVYYWEKYSLEWVLE